MEVLEGFLSRSFVVIYERPDGNPLIDISHESLISQWGRLKKWVDAEAESKRVLLDLVNAVERGKALLRDTDLQAALEWHSKLAQTTAQAWALDIHPAYPEVLDYIQASAAEKVRAEYQRARQTQILWGLGLALIVLTILILRYIFAA